MDYWMDEYVKARGNLERKLTCAVHIMMNRNNRELIESWIEEVEELFQHFGITFPRGHDVYDYNKKRGLLYQAWREWMKNKF